MPILEYSMFDILLLNNNFIALFGNKLHKIFVRLYQSHIILPRCTILGFDQHFIQYYSLFRLLQLLFDVLITHIIVFVDQLQFVILHFSFNAVADLAQLFAAAHLYAAHLDDIPVEFGLLDVQIGGYVGRHEVKPCPDVLPVFRVFDVADACHVEWHHLAVDRDQHAVFLLVKLHLPFEVTFHLILVFVAAHRCQVDHFRFFDKD